MTLNQVLRLDGAPLLNRTRVTALLVACLALAACGGDAAPGAASGPTPSEVSSPSEPPELSESPEPSEPTEPSEPIEPASGSEALCEAAQQISDLDDEGQAILNEMLSAVSTQTSNAAARRDFREGMRAFRDKGVELLPQVQATYDRLEAAVPQDLKDDVAILGKFTIDGIRLVSKLRSIEEFQTLEEMFVELGAQEAIQATLAIDKLTRDECGIIFAD